MKKDMSERTRNRKKSRFEPTPAKNYALLYEQNADVFSLLGQSKVYEQLSHTHSFDARNIIRVALSELDFNELTTPAQLSKIQGISIKTLDQLVELIEEVNFQGKNNVSVKNDDLDILVKEVIKRAGIIEHKLATRKDLLTPQDFIAVAQHRNITENSIFDELLLSEQKVNELGLRLARNAAPYKKEKSKKLYGWESIRAYNYNETLEIPMKNYYNNTSLLDVSEQSFPNEVIFKSNIQRKFNIKEDYRTLIKERPVILDGKNLVIDNQNLSKTEEAVL
ncbi:MAG: hypothetical protein CVV59_01710, partial [Tenericutes bacterium HGW-Tenericutes-4]